MLIMCRQPENYLPDDALQDVSVNKSTFCEVMLFNEVRMVFWTPQDS